MNVCASSWVRVQSLKYLVEYFCLLEIMNMSVCGCVYTQKIEGECYQSYSVATQQTLLSSSKHPTTTDKMYIDRMHRYTDAIPNTDRLEV